jgi:hypothetical protein
MRAPAFILPLAALYCHSLGARPSHCALSALHRIVSGATMTTTVRRARVALLHTGAWCCARRTGFYHGVGAPTTPSVRDSDPLSWIETSVTFVWYGGGAGEGLRSVGAEPIDPIQERVLYPAPRSPFTGRGRLQLVNPGPRHAATVLGRAGWSHPAARPLLCALEALRLVAGGETMSTPGAPGTTPRPGVLRLIALGAPASILGSELSVYLAPALRFFAPPQ